MRVKYRGHSYELPFFRALGYHLREAWFPFRRLLRAIKRTVGFLGSWVSTLIVFVPICIGVFYILLCKEIICFNTAIVEFISIFLGSFLLLAIKEIRDSEARRRMVLRKQWEYYSSWCYELVDVLQDFFCHLGLTICSYAFLNSTDDWESAFQSSTRTVSSPEKIGIDIEQINNINVIIIDTARDVGFIDWDVERANEYAKEIKRLTEKLSKDLKSNCSILQDADYLGKQVVALLGLVRRPWRYRNDMAHRELVERYLDQYGVRIEM